jgi:hypothetical protein
VGLGVVGLRAGTQAYMDRIEHSERIQ